MSRTPNYDKKIASILAATKPSERVCAATGEKWNVNERELEMYKRFQVPPSRYAPNTRFKILSNFSTGFQFWWNKHFDTGKPVLTFHHPASGVRVLPDAEWYSRDFSSVQGEMDVAEPFFDQVRRLQLQIPAPAAYNLVEPENSIALVSIGDKNSYFVLGCTGTNNFFSSLQRGENSSCIFDGDSVNNCHHVVHGKRLFNCRYVRESWDCMDSAFLFDCRNCKNCFGATNKRNREYLFFNEQLTKEKFEKRRKEIDLGRRSVVQEWSAKFDDLLGKQTIWPENFNDHAENSVGEYLNGAVDCNLCFTSVGSAKGNYNTAFSLGDAQRCDVCWAPKNSSDLYFSVTSPQSQGSKFLYRCKQTQESEYCIMCMNIKNCFGCIGLNRKEYCIFNKPYEPDEYWRRVDELKCAMLDRGEYGEFFPLTMSTTYPEDGGIFVYCAGSKDDLKALHAPEFDPNTENATGMENISTNIRQAADIPDCVDDLGDDWVGVPVYDPQTQRKFTFLKPEIDHYRALRIAPPTKHFVDRMREVGSLSQACRFEQRTCGQCQRAFTVTVNVRHPNRTIYCRECYLRYLEEHG